MNVSFKNMNINEFSEHFSTEEDCLKFLAQEKWGNDYQCKNCGNTNYCKGKTPYSRRCTRCKHDESVTANTLFHRCHIPITEAFRLLYLVCHDPQVSTYKLSRQIELRQMTCWKLKSRLMDCINNKGEVDLLYTKQN